MLGNKHSAMRLVAAERHLVDMLAHLGELELGDAERVARYYLAHRLARLDMVTGRATVKHGAFLDRAVIRRAVEFACVRANETRAK